MEALDGRIVPENTEVIDRRGARGAEKVDTVKFIVRIGQNYLALYTLIYKEMTAVGILLAVCKSWGYVYRL